MNEPTSVDCANCGKPKAIYDCELCTDSSCKKCGYILDASSFSFMNEIPEALAHTFYCGRCHDDVLQPAFDEYNEVMERAKTCFVFFKTQRKEVPLIKKEREMLRVAECIDRDETILRLAFFAAQKDYNAVIDCLVESEKIRDGAYQTSKWYGTGTPALVDGAKIDAQDIRNAMYR